MNFGILGCGKIAHRFIKGLNETKTGNLLAVASQSIERAQAFASQYDVKAYTTYTELLSNPEIDVVYIATYNPSHKELIHLCLEYKKHVICEKPMLKNVKDTKEAFAFARKQGCFLMEAHKAPFLPIYTQIETWIPLLGTPLYGSFDYAKRANHSPDHWVRDPEFGGSMKDVGCYPLSVIYRLFGDEFDNVSYDFLLGERGADDLGHVTFVKEGMILDAIGSYDVTLTNELRITGPNGMITSTDFWKSENAISVMNGNETKINYPHISEFTYYIEHVIECIENGLLESPIMSEAASIFCIQHANP